MTEHEPSLTCPSAPPASPDARVFGIVSHFGGSTRVEYLEKGVEVPKSVVESLQGVSPTRIFRFSAKCVEGGCAQFRDGGCRLGRDMVRELKPVVDTAPACTIRSTCRWFAENGAAACRRCPRIATEAAVDDVEIVRIATAG